MHVVARLSNLFRGAFAHWVRQREHRHPDAVYEAAIQERVVQYGKLRHATAGILYMRGKLARQLACESAVSPLRALRRALSGVRSTVRNN